MRISTVLSTILIIITVGLTGSWLYKKYHPKNKSLPYTTAKPQYRHIFQYITASGKLEAKEQLKVGSLEAGRVININVEENDIVKKGQVLAVLDNGIGDSAVKQLNASLDNAVAIFTYQKRFYNRQKEIFKAGQLSANAFDEIERDYLRAKANVTETKARLEIQQKTYDNLFIKSPDNGVVIAKRIDIGQMITSRLDAVVLFEIAKDLKHMEAEVDVDEADVGLVKDNQMAIFTVDSFPKRQFFSTVKRIHYLSKEVQNVISYGTILEVENKKLLLRPGMTTNVKIKVAEEQKALCVHNRALRIRGFKMRDWAQQHNHPFEPLPKKNNLFDRKQTKKSDRLWVLDNGSIKEVSVEFGINDGRYTQIKQGVTPDTLIIVSFEEQEDENILLKRVMGSRSGVGK